MYGRDITFAVTTRGAFCTRDFSRTVCCCSGSAVHTWQPAMGNSRLPECDASTSPTTASAASSAAALMRGLRAPEGSAAQAAPHVRVLEVKAARCLDAVARMGQAQACPPVSPECQQQGWVAPGRPACVAQAAVSKSAARAGPRGGRASGRLPRRRGTRPAAAPTRPPPPGLAPAPARCSGLAEADAKLTMHRSPAPCGKRRARAGRCINLLVHTLACPDSLLRSPRQVLRRLAGCEAPERMAAWLRMHQRQAWNGCTCSLPQCVIRYHNTD